MIGFERTKQSIQGPRRYVTSWVRPGKQVYRASAPGLSPCDPRWPATSLQGRTREQAIKNLAVLLCHHFEGSPARV